MIEGIEIGLTCMAGFSLLCRMIGHAERRAVLLPLMAFQFVLAAFVALGGLPPVAELTLLLLLILLLPWLLQMHMSALTGRALIKGSWSWAAFALLPAPLLSLSPEQQYLIWQGGSPNHILSLASAASFGLFALISLFASGALTLSVARQWHAHRRFLRTIYAQTARGAEVTSGLLWAIPIASLVFYVLSLLGAGAGINIGAVHLGHVILCLACLGFAAHGMTIEILPGWAEALAPGQLTDQEKPSYARSGLGNAELDAILARLDKAMGQSTLWLSPNLTLKDLAQAAGSKPGYVSQALNQRRELTFFEYVNGYRIDDAANRLITTEDTVLDICFGVGFNAKSTFNAAFRKYKGETPSAWRKRHKYTPTG